MGQRARQKLRENLGFLQFSKLHSNTSYEAFAQKGARIDWQVHISDSKQARWQKLRIAFGLYGK